MLGNIRKTSNKLLIRILLGFVALAFISFGIKDVMQSKNDYNIVTFSKIPNITRSEFLRAKSEQINYLQRLNKTHLTEEEIAQLGVDKIILQNLIRDRILQNLVNEYQLNLSDNFVIEVIKESPKFKNDKGIFDINIFRSVLKNSMQSEEEYITESKNKILMMALISVFLESFKVPNVMIKNEINYMSERREFDLVQMDLTAYDKNSNLPILNEFEIEEFYKKKKDLFAVQEKRSLSYIKISPKLLRDKINISDEELLKFYNENKEEFSKPNSSKEGFEKIKPQVKSKLIEQKLNHLFMSTLQTLEDDVAAGLSLNELAEKFAITIEKLDYKTYNEVLQNEKLKAVADLVWELGEKELSYPTEIKDKNEIVVVEVNSIIPTYTPRLEEVKDKVIELLHSERLKKSNLEKLKNFSKEYNPTTVNNNELLKLGIKVSSNNFIIRKKLKENDKLPTDLLLSILQAQKGKVTPVFKHGSTGYFAYLRAIKHDNETVNEAQKDSIENISLAIKNSILDEIINHEARKHNITQNINN